VTTPGDNCPECDRRLSGDACSCGWRAGARPATTTCAKCQAVGAEVREYEGQWLCLTCRHVVLRANASSPDDVYAGRTVREMMAEFRETMARNAHKWESKRDKLGQQDAHIGVQR